MFEFRHQPLKGIYLAFFIISILFVRLPYWVFIAVFPSLRPRRSWSFSRSVLFAGIRAYVESMFVTSPPSPPAGGPDAIASSPDAEKVGFTWVPPLPEELIKGDIKEMMGIQGVTLEKPWGFWFQSESVKEPKDRKAGPDEKIYLHFHAGGLIMGSAHPNEGAVWPFLSGLLGHSKSITRIFAAGYRLSSSSPFPSKNPFPAALLDILASYHFLIHSLGFSPTNIIVGGESAGATLALALVRYAAREGLQDKGLPVPGAMLLVSPTGEWVVTHTGPNASMTRNKRSDFVGPIFKGYTARSILGVLPSSYAVTSPWFAPSSLQLPEEALEGLFSGFPRKIYILIGEAEMLLDSARTLKERLVKDLGEESVKYNEVPDAMHAITSMPWYEPERTEALKDICAWIDML